jgi:hypothetical protein
VGTAFQYLQRLVVSDTGMAFDLGGRDLFFFVRESGRWRAVADQFSPFPA